MTTSNFQTSDPSKLTAFDDAPGADIPFDELFPPEDGLNLQTTAETGTHQPPAQQPQAQAQDEFVLRTSTGTVYKTIDDAVKGIEHKDALIEQYRQRERVLMGLPSVGGESQAQPPVNYARQPQRFHEDLTRSVSDPMQFAQVQAKFVMDLLEPIAPVIQDVAKQRALETVSGENTDIRKFLGSPEYSDVLKDSPALARAIEAAEGDFNYYSNLPELYRLAYLTSQGRKLPELLKAAQASAPPAAQPARTMSAGTLTPASPSVTPGVRPGSREERQRLFDSLRSQGIDDIVF